MFILKRFYTTFPIISVHIKTNAQHFESVDQPPLSGVKLKTIEK